MLISRESPVPIYYQIALHLRSRIMGKEWRSGEKIPPEEALSAEYGVSRVTMRQALAELVKDGLLARQQGRGTFVKQIPQPLVHNFNVPILFAGQLRKLGYTLSHEILERKVFDTPFPHVAERLGLTASQPVAYLKRLLMINEQPMAVNHSWFSEELVPGIAVEPLVDGSLSGTLARRYNYVPARSENLIEVARATESESQWLEITRDTPLLVLTSISFLVDDTPLEYSITSWLGDNIRFHFDVRFDAGAASAVLHTDEAALDAVNGRQNDEDAFK
ncbi:MAG: GntR family transcriptional regulator [Caldilineaceae bacterium]|nr:GntR family transcriptional regulator [Caldilineaceae bacterium]MCB9137944.1 GntR family transcriptional regulator [Caldilineaceae bacterium]